MAAEPGWYPDPSGTDGQRWWDGVTWSEHRRPYPAPEAVHPPTFANLAVPPPQLYAPGYYAVPPVRQPDPGAAYRGRTLGIIGISLCAAAVVFALPGGSFDTVNWMLVVGMLVFAPAATIIGIIAVVFASKALGSGVAGADRGAAKQAMALGVISICTFPIVFALGLIWNLLLHLSS